MKLQALPERSSGGVAENQVAKLTTAILSLCRGGRIRPLSDHEHSEEECAIRSSLFNIQHLALCETSG